MKPPRDNGKSERARGLRTKLWSREEKEPVKETWGRGSQQGRNKERGVVRRERGEMDEMVSRVPCLSQIK